MLIIDYVNFAPLSSHSLFQCSSVSQIFLFIIVSSKRSVTTIYIYVGVLVLFLIFLYFIFGLKNHGEMILLFTWFGRESIKLKIANG